MNKKEGDTVVELFDLLQEINHRMLQQMPSAKYNRFVSNDILELQEVNRAPKADYKYVPLVCLEEAVETIAPFVPHVREYANTAKVRCRKNAELSPNESAAIYLYTMITPFNEEFNKVLRSENSQALTPWLGFLNLFMSALEKLPMRSTTVWRGIRGNIGSNFNENTKHIWWGVNSCSPKIDVAESFSSEKGSLFCINTIYGKDITLYSANTDEEEIILMPGTSLRVESTSINNNGYFMVHLNEW